MQSIHELPQSMGYVLVVLMAGSVFSGYFLRDPFVGVGSVFWSNSIYILSKNSNGLDYEFIPTIYKILPLLFSLVGIIFALSLNKLLKFIQQQVKLREGRSLEFKPLRVFHSSRTLRFLVKSI